MAVHRTPPLCLKCGKIGYTAVHNDSDRTFMGDTFSHWEAIPHRCKPTKPTIYPKPDIPIKTDKEIEKEVREEMKDMPEGGYRFGDMLYTGKEGMIMMEIGIRKYVRDM